MTVWNALRGLSSLDRCRAFLAVTAVILGLATPVEAQQPAASAAPLPSLALPAALAAKYACLADRSKALIKERNDLKTGYAGLKKDGCASVDERDTAKIKACTDKKEELAKETALHRQRSEEFVKDWKRIPANSGCVFEGQLRPSGVASHLALNFVNYCNAPKYVSLCTELTNGAKNNLANNIDPCRSVDFKIPATVANHCWVEGVNACPCKTSPRR
ncbi:MAG TPA: hypothetical protein VFB45_01165 [Pseudolabrys sp.]|nr:hypothetical protein [Pseudolabrys sp.]